MGMESCHHWWVRRVSDEGRPDCHISCTFHTLAANPQGTSSKLPNHTRNELPHADQSFTNNAPRYPRYPQNIVKFSARNRTKNKYKCWNTEKNCKRPATYRWNLCLATGNTGLISLRYRLCPNFFSVSSYLRFGTVVVFVPYFYTAVSPVALKGSPPWTFSTL